LLDNLTRYTLVHFRDEEHLMAKKMMVRDYLVHHHQTHQAFVDELTQMRRQYEQEGTLSGTDMLRFLGSWLSFHILVEDQCMATQMKDMDAGLTAMQAHERANHPQDGAHAVYTSSLLELFTLLSERNQKLTLANDEVRQAKAALEVVNQSLELRVQERTRDLAATVARLQHTQNQLLQSEKMAAVGQLAAGVAHEINNPLGFVTSNLGALANYLNQLFGLIDVCQGEVSALPAGARIRVDEAAKHIELEFLREDIPGLIRESREGLARVKRIVSDLQDFSVKDEGVWALADLNHSMESALNVVGNELKSKAEVIRQLAPLPPVWCIASEINQVLVNLLLNAAQAIEVRGVVTVRTQTQKEHVLLEVSDTGCGMSDEVQSRIFEPFYTTKAIGKGTGLGLSTVWEIIRRHNGHVEVRSIPGAGTTFLISLPLQPTTDPVATA
jgi:signal transduction histidine kinase